jgi:hypothetical protein
MYNSITGYLLAQRIYNLKQLDAGAGSGRAHAPRDDGGWTAWWKVAAGRRGGKWRLDRAAEGGEGGAASPTRSVDSAPVDCSTSKALLFL